MTLEPIAVGGNGLLIREFADVTDVFGELLWVTEIVPSDRFGRKVVRVRNDFRSSIIPAEELFPLDPDSTIKLRTWYTNLVR